jgi:hypothetical protein
LIVISASVIDVFKFIVELKRRYDNQLALKIYKNMKEGFMRWMYITVWTFKISILSTIFLLDFETLLMLDKHVEFIFFYCAGK